MLLFIPRSLVALKRLAGASQRYSATSGLRLSLNYNLWRAEVTDGRRLLVVQGEQEIHPWPGLEVEVDERTQVVIPFDDLEKAVKLAKDRSSRQGTQKIIGVATTAASDCVYLGIGPDYLKTWPVEGRFPDTQAVLTEVAENPLFTVKLDPRLMGEIMKVMADLQDEAPRVQVFFCGEDKPLVLMAKTGEFIAEGLIVPLLPDKIEDSKQKKWCSQRKLTADMDDEVVHALIAKECLDEVDLEDLRDAEDAPQVARRMARVILERRLRIYKTMDDKVRAEDWSEDMEEALMWEDLDERALMRLEQCTYQEVQDLIAAPATTWVRLGENDLTPPEAIRLGWLATEFLIERDWPKDDLAPEGTWSRAAGILEDDDPQQVRADLEEQDFSRAQLEELAANSAEWEVVRTVAGEMVADLEPEPEPERVKPKKKAKAKPKKAAKSA